MNEEEQKAVTQFNVAVFYVEFFGSIYEPNGKDLDKIIIEDCINIIEKYNLGITKEYFIKNHTCKGHYIKIPYRNNPTVYEFSVICEKNIPFEPFYRRQFMEEIKSSRLLNGEEE